MDDDDELSVSDEAISYEWRPSHQMADALFLAASIARSAADFLDSTAARAAYHHNYLIEREEFAAEAAAELGTITKPPEE